MLVINAASRIPFGILSIVETVSITPGTTAPVLSDTVPNSLPSARPCGAGGDAGRGADDLLPLQAQRRLTVVSRPEQQPLATDLLSRFGDPDMARTGDQARLEFFKVRARSRRCPA